LVNVAGHEREHMKRIARTWTLLTSALLKWAPLALVAAVAPSLAGDYAIVRNCTWCHGTSGQGYTVAPRLAGQRPLYLETQIRSFR